METKKKANSGLSDSLDLFQEDDKEKSESSFVCLKGGGGRGRRGEREREDIRKKEMRRNCGRGRRLKRQER